MKYRHLDDEEREQIAHMKLNGKSQRDMVRKLGPLASTISRELASNRYPTDGSYKVLHAGAMARGRRRRARQGSRFEEIHWMEVEALLRQDSSPEQVSGMAGQAWRLSSRNHPLRRGFGAPAREIRIPGRPFVEALGIVKAIEVA